MFNIEADYPEFSLKIQTICFQIDPSWEGASHEHRRLQPEQRRAVQLQPSAAHIFQVSRCQKMSG